MKTIAEYQHAYKKPEIGLVCKTVIDEDIDSGKFFTKPEHIAARKSADGTFLGYTPGCAGEIWLVKHLDESVGVYSVREVFDR